MKELSKKIKIIIIILITISITYLLIISPYISFKTNENLMKKSAERYYEINEDKLPVGKGIKTIYLKELYSDKYIEKLFYQPLSRKVCSTTKSWVKTKRENDKYKHYVYLDCNLLKSTVDHTGPQIKLKGEDKITVDRFSKYKDPGIESVIDNTDGNLNIKNVKIKKDIDTSKVGKYTVYYSAMDSFNNETEVKREVEVVYKLSKMVEKETKIGYYTGLTPNNYIKFSNNLFRIVKKDKENIQIVSERPVANVNYGGLEKYLNVYYDSLSSKSKKLIVENKYCNSNISEKEFTTTECASSTENKKISIPTIDLINKSLEDNSSYLLNDVISWSNHKSDSKKALAFKSFFQDTLKHYSLEDDKNLYGLKPLITIQGNNLIKAGEGTKENPYILKDDSDVAKSGTKVNERVAGEYLNIKNNIFRISKILGDGTVKVIMVQPLRNSNGDVIKNRTSKQKDILYYNPRDVKNIAYYIDNKASQYIDTKPFVRHNIKVPTYKKDILYLKEYKTKNYNVKLSAPDAFDLYNIQEESIEYKGDHYNINTSEQPSKSLITLYGGTPVLIDSTEHLEYGIKITAYLSKEYHIVSGNGSLEKPYNIAK